MIKRWRDAKALPRTEQDRDTGHFSNVRAISKFCAEDVQLKLAFRPSETAYMGAPVTRDLESRS